MNLRQFIIKEGQFNKDEFMKLFKPIESSKFSLVPWSIPNFWDNVISEDFANLFTSELLRFLVSELSAYNSSKQQNPSAQEPNVTYESCLQSLMNMVICRHIYIPDNIWKDPYNQLVNSGNLSLSYVMVFLNKLLSQNEISMKTRIDSITNKYDQPILLSSIPISYFFDLFRLLSKSPFAPRWIILAMKQRLESINNLQEAACLLHILFVIISIFPQFEHQLLDVIIEPLKQSLIFPHPVSSLGSEIGQLLELDAEYPGAAYFNLLQRIGKSNVATNGHVHVLFDHNATFLPNLLHERYMTKMNLEQQLLNFGTYFVVKKLHIYAEKPKHIVRILQMVGLSAQSDAKIWKKLQVTKIPPNEPYFDTSILKPPIIGLIPIKLSIDYDVDVKLTVNGPSDTKFLLVPCTEILNSTVFQPLMDYIISHESPATITHNIVILGGDNVLSSITQSLYLCLSKFDASVVKRLSFNLYVMPIDHSNAKVTNVVSDYIASKDDAYNRFVNRVYELCTNMAPRMNEEATPLLFPTIHSSEPKENNPWLDPLSPDVIMQNALQHYIAFARYTVSLHVWVASLQFLDDSIVQIPFVVSLHIGAQLLGNDVPGFTENDEKKIKTKKWILITDVDNEMKNIEATSIAFWSINKEQHIRPSDQVLLLETVDEPGKVSITDREASSTKMTRAPITTGSVNSGEKVLLSFKVFVDNRTFESVKNVKVEPMQHYIGSGKQMTVKIATFAPIE